MKRISIKDIARIAGTSPTTVSFVLNGKAKEMRISDAIAKKILATTKKYGYKPNQIAVTLRTGQSKIIGLIVESIGGAFFGALAKVIEAEAEKYGYRVVYCSTENDARKGKDMIKMLAHQQVDGYIITPTVDMEDDIADLIKQEKPVVLMDSFIPSLNVPHVLVDNFLGVKEGVISLIEAGYKNIGFITVDLDLIQMNERLRGFTETLKLHKLKSDKKNILKLPYKNSKEEIIQKIAAFLEKNKQLDAVFFATNYLGTSGLQAIKKLGLRIPEDIAMISFDEHEIFSLYTPGITTIQQPIEEIGSTAMHLLLTQLGKIAKDGSENKIQIAPTLISRASSKAL
jgi:LacI family transcriptional regulator